MSTASLKQPKVNAYDRVPYPKVTHPETHPRNLEAMAALFGMRPRAVTAARVLELGCASGWNLASPASDFPGSQFLGVDYSGAQIADGQAFISRLGLRNMELREASILDVDSSWGRFDYIICHGVYSWVPPAVRDRVLAICSENLAAQGVALVSYNASPGWQLRGMVRSMMLFHVRKETDPLKRAAESRRVLDVMARACPEESAYGRVLRSEREMLSRCTDEYLLHDHLEENNHPVFFTQFIEHAASKKLQYLGETRLSSMVSGSLGEEVREFLSSCSILEYQQYLDFLRNRSFRRTLLCHADIPLDRRFDPGLMGAFHFSLRNRIEHRSEDRDSALEFELEGMRVRADQEVPKAAIRHLADCWPTYLSFGELLSHVRTNSGSRKEGTSGEEAELAAVLMSLLKAGSLEAFVHPPQFSSEISSHPVAAPLVRLQALESDKVTSRRHRPVRLDALGRRILPMLDGGHDKNALLRSIQKDLRAGSLTITRKDGVRHQPGMEGLTRLVDALLDFFRDEALLLP